MLKVIKLKRGKLYNMKFVKSNVKESILTMSLEADKSAAEVEVKHIFTLIAKSTTFRPKIGEKNEKKFRDQVCVSKKNVEVME